MAVERLQKILSNAGIASRREAEDWLLEGRITVNGNPVTELGARADLDTDEILVDGIPVNRGMYRYFVLNKPVGVLTTAKDDRGRATVLDLVPIGDIVLHPVGRLDLDSEGLLLITNDGHLTDLLTHPRNEVEKEYLVGTDTQLSKTDIQRLVRGIDDKGEHLRATSAIVVNPPARLDEDAGEVGAWALLTLKEGKNREIRRMMEALGKSVKLLRRTRIARLHLGDIGPGVFRELTDQEVSLLYRDAMASKKLAEERAAAEARVTPTISRIAPARAQQPTRERRDPDRTFSARPPRAAGQPGDDRGPRGGGRPRTGGGGGRPAGNDSRGGGPRAAAPRRPSTRTGAPAESASEGKPLRDGARPRIAPPTGMSGPSRVPARPGDRRDGGGRPPAGRPSAPGGERRFGGEGRGPGGPGGERRFGGESRGPGGPGGERRFGGESRGPGGPGGERRFGGEGRGPGGPGGERRFGGESRGPGGERRFGGDSRGPGGPGGERRFGGGDRRGPGGPGGRPPGGGRPQGGPGRGPSGPRRGR